MTPAPRRSLPAANFHIVDLFAGPGGLDIAATIMGVESIGVEWDDPTRATRTAAGLRTTREKDVAELGPCDPEVADANVLTGGPPCQSFSVAGNREGHQALEDVKRLATRLAGHEDAVTFEAAWKEVKAETDAMSDDRTGLVLQPLRWIMEAKLKREKPYDVIVLEQVPTVLPVWKHYVGILRATGYAADAHVMNAEQFGVPQTRRRAVLIARYAPADEEKTVAFPSPTHQRYRPGAERLPEVQEPEEGRPGEDRQEALFTSTSTDRPIIRWTAMQDVLRDRPADFEVVSNYGSGGDPKKRGRRTSEEPAATVTGKVRRNRVFRLQRTAAGTKQIGEELDRLTLREAGLLQSFPAAYPWRSTDVAQQIGNAIPPRLSLHILSCALGFGEPEEKLLTRLEEWQPPGAGEPSGSA
ncbi:DNA cytosine methyltransferase [Streptomyces venezuelae]|uniref:DNA cytosine methyltransferase n=1 Tax=Streptomyces venezuelae TaxID=54571 RepID=UPI0034310EAA